MAKANNKKKALIPISNPLTSTSKKRLPKKSIAGNYYIKVYLNTTVKPY